ncbi:oligopeptidase A [Ereboglobus sp. PH5-10]|nr:oligopeptidase A [Ereboglobus sp. PH5-10]
MEGIMDHPFLDARFEIPWSRLTPDRVKPDITKAIADAKAQVDAIAALPLGSLTYENTFAALERVTEHFRGVWNRVEHLKSVADSPAVRAAYNEMQPVVTAFGASIPLNAELWKRLKTYSESGDAKGAARKPVELRLISETLAEFRQQGADLPPEKRARMAELEKELAQLTQKFSENVLDATNAYELVITDESRLAGLPERAKNAARANAESKGLSTPEKPAWRFTLHAPSLNPVLTYADDASLRRELFEASNAVGARAPSDNTPLIPRILALRAEKAALLGKAHFPDMILERRMAKSGARAIAFVNDLQRRTKPAFDRECESLEAFAGRKGEHLAPWDLSYYAEKMRKKLHDFDEEALRPYFPADRVFAGLFEVCNRIYGITVKERETGTGPGKVEVWHPDVKFYEVYDANGTHLGSFYSDWYPRESKRSGAWMDAFVTGGPRADGSWAPHLGLICGNMTPPVDGKPALLDHREVETIFHEFGHLMHHLFGAVPVKSLNGTNVAWDFVELPSQIMENWTWEREGLDLFARHYKTGEKIPDELFRRMIAARNFRSACGQMRQLSFGTMDLLLHISAGEFKREPDVEPGIRRLITDCLIPTNPPARTNVNRFHHLFSSPVGYASGYYSYKWAEVLDADAFTRFQREGIFNAATGKAFRDTVLSKGNSEDADKLYRDFMGRDPSIDALMKRNGLA